MASLSYRMALVSPPKMSSSQLKIGHVIQRQSQFMSQASVEIAGLTGEQLSSSAENFIHLSKASKKMETQFING